MYRKILTIAISTLIAVGIMAFMLAQVWDDLLKALQHFIPAFLICAIILCLFAWALRGLRYQLILQNLEIQVSTLFSTGCIFVSQTANLIVPARLGDFVRVFILKQEQKATYSEGVSSLVVERVFDILSVALLGITSFIFIRNVPADLKVLMIIPLFIGIIFFCIIIAAGKLSAKNRYFRIILTILEEIGKASLTIRAIILLGISSIIIWILDSPVCFFISMMFQVTIPFIIVTFAVIVGNLVKAFPITQGGLGVYEASVAYILYSLAGVSPAAAMLIAIVDHLVKNLITLAGGVISIYFLGDSAMNGIKTAVTNLFSRGSTDAKD